MLIGNAKVSLNSDAILIIGDSLSAEYGLERGTGWVALLQKKLIMLGKTTKVINASISGDTTAGGRIRLSSLINLHHPNLVIIELGGNDALRGLNLNVTKANLTEIARICIQAGSKVILVGMQVPPNYGKVYSENFSKIYTQVARDENIQLVPFFLSEFANNKDLSYFQKDRIHPTAKGHPLMLNTIWPIIQKNLE